MKHPFRWLLGGQAISALGSQVTFMALPLIVATWGAVQIVKDRSEPEAVVEPESLRSN